MKRNILFISDQIIRPLYAVRLQSLCNHLLRQGWGVQVVAEKGDELNFEHDYPITTIDIYGKHCRTFKRLLAVLFDWKNKAFARQVSRLVAANSYDVVCCTTFSNFPLMAAAQVADKKNIPFVADIRDLDEQVEGVGQHYARLPKYLQPLVTTYRKININRRNKQLKKAKLITTVSDWHTQFLKQINPNTELVRNGFDATLFKPVKQPTTEFKLVYTGRVYNLNTQNPTLLFQALQQLPDVIVEWYTDAEGWKRISTFAKEYGVLAQQRYMGECEHSKVPAILAEASVVLILSSNQTHGVLTTKFYEAYAMNRPILCVRSDEGELAKSIKQTNAGLAATTVKEVVDFISNKKNEWNQNHYIWQQHANVDFSRQHQAQLFEQLINKII